MLHPPPVGTSSISLLSAGTPCNFSICASRSTRSGRSSRRGRVVVAVLVRKASSGRRRRKAACCPRRNCPLLGKGVPAQLRLLPPVVPVRKARRRWTHRQAVPATKGEQPQ
ncbi:unnamed protein product [Amoebophrya sp. A120]|nr:unnamed protein product [Amoebophrya sp. A120]|eukprot:GSA120T00019218001.1